MDWSSLSPDLAPMENVRGDLKDRVNKREPAPANIHYLGIAFQQEWWNIPQARISTLITSMRWKCVACVAAQGRHMEYTERISFCNLT